MIDFQTTPALCPALKRNLARHNYVKPTPVQEKAVPPALEGRDVVATAQTGTGKTLAFALPIAQRLLSATSAPKGVQAVILTPTRELAIQINETIQKLTMGSPIKSAVVVGGMAESKQLLAIRKGAQILVATPGRLCDFLERRLVNLSTAAVLVLDEADRMLDMGFLPSIRSIMKQLPTERQTLLFSATIEKTVQHLMESSVKNPARITIGSTTKPAENVDLHHYEVEQSQKLALLSHLLDGDSNEGPVLVFARTKHGADRLAKALSARSYRAARIHGDRTQAQRNHALAGFKDGSYRVLVATDVAARGIHVDGISHVVNFDLPQVPEDFIHRVGRTGRAGARGIASTFSVRAERGEIRKIERTLNLRLKDIELPKGLAAAAAAAEQAPKVIVIPVKAAELQNQLQRRPRRFARRMRK